MRGHIQRKGKKRVNSDLLCRALIHLQDQSDCQLFLKYLLTEEELQTVVQRWNIAWFWDVEKTTNDLVKLTGASRATVKHGTKEIDHLGRRFETMLDEIKGKEATGAPTNN